MRRLDGKVLMVAGATPGSAALASDARVKSTWGGLG
jgi:hypothetical protein